MPPAAPAFLASVREAPRGSQQNYTAGPIGRAIFLLAVTMVLAASFNGAGDTTTPTLRDFAVFWLWEIPLAYALSITLGTGPHGAFLAITVAFSTLIAASAALFRRGQWKARRV